MPKRTKKNFKINPKIIGIVYLSITFLIILFLVFNEKGMLKYLEVKGRVEELETQLKASEQQIDMLKAEIDSLKNNRFKIEEVAREKYNMKRPDEKGLDIEVK